jgi:hypothetical protein
MIEAFIFLALGAGGFFIFSKLKEQNTERILKPIDGSLDDVSEFIHYKRRYLTTSVHEQESTYMALYDRVRNLYEAQIRKYDSIFLAKETAVNEKFESYFTFEKDIWRVRRDLDVRSLESDLLLSLARSSLFGRTQINGKHVAENRFLTNRIIELLIVERAYEPARLARGLIQLCGFQEWLKPRVEDAETDLRTVLDSFRHINQHLARTGLFGSIEQVKTKSQPHASELWRSHSELESLLAIYDPKSHNG